MDGRGGRCDDFEVGPGSLVEGNNLGDGFTQGYIYVHIIGEYGERSNIPAAGECQIPQRRTLVYAQAHTHRRVFTSTHIHTRIRISIDSIEINTQG